jgi:uncharacterized protein (TIGR02678 family)
LRTGSRRGAARLFKTAPELSDASHPARGHNCEPFGRRRYVTLCLARSALARADAQTTLGSLADDVLTAAAEPELAGSGFTLTLDNRSDRSDLVAVVRICENPVVVARRNSRSTPCFRISVPDVAQRSGSEIPPSPGSLYHRAVGDGAHSPAP